MMELLGKTVTVTVKIRLLFSRESFIRDVSRGSKCASI